MKLLPRIGGGELRRWVRERVSARSFRYGTNAAVLSLIVLGLLVIISVAAIQHPKMVDLTETKRYSLSEESASLLRNLTKGVKVLGFFPRENPARDTLRDLLEQYAYHTRHFSYAFVDPDRQPSIAKRYDVTMYGTIVVSCGDRHQKVFHIDEETITNAIVKVIREGQKVIYFLTGHGEKDIKATDAKGYTEIKKAIIDQNYDVRPLLLLREAEVPEDAAVIVVAGPEKDLLQEELHSTSEYINQGGRLLVMVDPGTAPGLRDYLKQYGIRLGDDMVVDKLSRLFGADFFIPVVTSYERHPITKNFNVATFYPLARTVNINTPLPDNIDVRPLAMTSPGSWAETDVETLLAKGQAKFDEGVDTQGPVPLAAVVTIRLEDEADGGEEREAQIVVFGDSEFVDNSHLHLSGNNDLFLNAINWLAEEEDLIFVRPKETKSSLVFLTTTQSTLIKVVSIFVIPGITCALGAGVIWRRRRKR